VFKIARNDYYWTLHILVNNGVGLSFLDLIDFWSNKYYDKDTHNTLLINAVYKKVFELRLDTVIVNLWAQ